MILLLHLILLLHDVIFIVVWLDGFVIVGDIYDPYYVDYDMLKMELIISLDCHYAMNDRTLMVYDVRVNNVLIEDRCLSFLYGFIMEIIDIQYGLTENYQIVKC